MLWLAESARGTRMRLRPIFNYFIISGIQWAGGIRWWLENNMQTSARQNDETHQAISSMVALRLCTRGNRLALMEAQCKEEEAGPRRRSLACGGHASQNGTSVADIKEWRWKAISMRSGNEGELYQRDQNDDNRSRNARMSSVGGQAAGFWLLICFSYDTQSK